MTTTRIQPYLNLTSELLQDLFNFYTNDNQLFTYAFKQQHQDCSEEHVIYNVTISNPTKQHPIPSIVYNIRVIFKLPSSMVMKKLESLPFIQHVQFLVEHRKEPFELSLNIEEGLMSTSRESIKQQIDLIALINQHIGKEINPKVL